MALLVMAIPLSECVGWFERAQCPNGAKDVQERYERSLGPKFNGDPVWAVPSWACEKVKGPGISEESLLAGEERAREMRLLALRLERYDRGLVGS